jgi:glutamate-1-semialdehyde 2,1-aminomutase
MKAGPHSQSLQARALARIPGGVNSPVRAFKAVGGSPPFIVRGSGSRLYDVDNNSAIDLMLSWGPLILGHAHPAVVSAISQAAVDGTSFGAATAREVEYAEYLCSLMPSLEMVRLVSSGTEATLSAVRLARAATGRSRIIKFTGHYHGHADSFLVKAGSGALTLGTPSSPGVPEPIASLTLTARFNDLPSVDALLASYGKEIAALIVEPVAGNMGTILPEPGFLQGLRERCTKHGVVLIFDEVMCGFRCAFGGAQAKFDVTPDLTTLGKVIGGGMPLAAYGGRRDLMEQMAPAGPVYQAGTLSGNPVAIAAGLTTLKLIAEPGAFASIEDKTTRLCTALRGLSTDARKVSVTQAGTMFTLFLQPEPPRHDGELPAAAPFARFFTAALERGVYFPPSAYETAFLSAAHSPQDLEQVVSAVDAALKA